MDPNLLATCSFDRTVRIYSMHTLQCTKIIKCKGACKGLLVKGCVRGCLQGCLCEGACEGACARHA
eukprot:18102-Chlamydomonas_euryale.AAC.2